MSIGELVARAVVARNERLRSKKVKRKKKKPEILDGSEEFYSAIRELYEKGFALKDIAKAMGVGYNRLLYIVKKMGLKRKFYQRKVYDAGKGSCALILPNEYVKQLGIKPGDVVYIWCEGDKVVVSKNMSGK
jgi:hypothetical protein